MTDDTDLSSACDEVAAATHDIQGHADQLEELVDMDSPMDDGAETMADVFARIRAKAERGERIAREWTQQRDTDA